MILIVWVLIKVAIKHSISENNLYLYVIVIIKHDHCMQINVKSGNIYHGFIVFLWLNI